jgi:Anti-sigma-K factor rskA, C-terminal/Putative zinc-finger
MAMTCDRVRELASGFVLGALDPGEMIALSDHLESCPQPHPEIDELGGVLPYLAESLEPVEPPAWLRESVVAAATADLAARRSGRYAPTRIAAAASTPVPLPIDASRAGEIVPLARARLSRRRIATWATRAAAVIAIAAVAGFGLEMQGTLARALKNNAEDNNINYALQQPDTRTAVMSAADGSKASGIAALRPTGHIIVWLYGLKATTGDQVYVVWLSSGVGATTKAGSFTVDDSGKGYLEVDSVPTSGSLWIFVNREANDQVVAPTGPMVVSGTISS